MATDRIYAVKNHDSNTTRLIGATSKAAALSHAVKTTLTVDLATQAHLVSLTKLGVEVEKAEAPEGV